LLFGFILLIIPQVYDLIADEAAIDEGVGFLRSLGLRIAHADIAGFSQGDLVVVGGWVDGGEAHICFSIRHEMIRPINPLIKKKATIP
jgi:hypothetical protein